MRCCPHVPRRQGLTSSWGVCARRAGSVAAPSPAGTDQLTARGNRKSDRHQGALACGSLPSTHAGTHIHTHISVLRTHLRPLPTRDLLEGRWKPPHNSGAAPPWPAPPEQGSRLLSSCTGHIGMSTRPTRRGRGGTPVSSDPGASISPDRTNLVCLCFATPPPTQASRGGKKGNPRSRVVRLVWGVGLERIVFLFLV